MFRLLAHKCKLSVATCPYLYQPSICSTSKTWPLCSNNSVCMTASYKFASSCASLITMADISVLSSFEMASHADTRLVVDHSDLLPGSTADGGSYRKQEKTIHGSMVSHCQLRSSPRILLQPLDHLQDAVMRLRCFSQRHLRREHQVASSLEEEALGTREL